MNKSMQRLMMVAVVSAALLLPANAHAWYTYGNTWGMPSSTTSTSVQSVEQSLLSMLNAERTKRGLKPLVSDSAINAAARLKSQDMVRRNYFSHTSPTYGSPAQLLRSRGITYRTYGENIAKGASAARIHAMWMASPGHRANILNPSFTHVGIGAATSSGGLTATQLFVGR